MMVEVVKAEEAVEKKSRKRYKCKAKINNQINKNQ